MAIPIKERGYQKDAWGLWGDEHEHAPDLVWPSNIEAYDRMRREDTQIRSILQAATLPIRRTKWFVNPAGSSPDVARFVADNLGLPVKGDSDDVPSPRGVDRFSWDDHLRLALLELVFGHSFFEQVYRVDEGGRARLRRLGWRPPRTIAKIDVADDGGLVSISQLGSLSGKSSEIPVTQLVAYVNEREGGNWLGQSVLRPAYKFWLLKDALLRTQAQTIQRNGMGVPVYTSPDFSAMLGAGMTAAEVRAEQEAELERGQGIASGYRSGDNSGVALVNGADLTLKGVTGELPDAMPAIRYYDEQISASVLANFLKLGGSDSTGSYALGATFADFFVMSLQAEALHIADVTNQHVVNDLVDINFGKEVPAPRVAFEEIGTSQHATAVGIAQLVGCGALTPDASLEAFIRDMLGIPPSSGEPLAQPTTRARIARLISDLHAASREAGWTAWEGTNEPIPA